MRTTDLPQQMKMFNVWEEWAAGTRGRPVSTAPAQ
jgi:carboxypeptidase Q